LEPFKGIGKKKKNRGRVGEERFQKSLAQPEVREVKRWERTEAISEDLGNPVVRPIPVGKKKGLNDLDR